MVDKDGWIGNLHARVELTSVNSDGIHEITRTNKTVGSRPTFEGRYEMMQVIDRGEDPSKDRLFFLVEENKDMYPLQFGMPKVDQMDLPPEWAPEGYQQLMIDSADRLESGILTMLLPIHDDFFDDEDNAEEELDEETGMLGFSEEGTEMVDKVDNDKDNDQEDDNEATRKWTTYKPIDIFNACNSDGSFISSIRIIEEQYEQDRPGIWVNRSDADSKIYVNCSNPDGTETCPTFIGKIFSLPLGNEVTFLKLTVTNKMGNDILPCLVEYPIQVRKRTSVEEDVELGGVNMSSMREFFDFDEAALNLD